MNLSLVSHSSSSVFHSVDEYEGFHIAESGNNEGKIVEITAMENGYNLTDGAASMNLVFDEETQIWSAEYNNQTTQLMKFVDENNAQLFLLNGDVMDVTLDAQGVEMARMYMNNSFALK